MSVISIFKVFVYPVQAECTKVTKFCNHFEGKVYLYVTLLFNFMFDS
jgi:hypothetical protein